MQVKFSKDFDKQTSRVKDKVLINRIGKIIQSVMDCASLKEIPNLVPITGNQGYFRIRLGSYRIGILLEGDTVWFLFFGKRDESTYRKFP
jgi:mRNA interferase RelE/StbE